MVDYTLYHHEMNKIPIDKTTICKGQERDTDQNDFIRHHYCGNELKLRMRMLTVAQIQKALLAFLWCCGIL